MLTRRWCYLVFRREFDWVQALDNWSQSPLSICIEMGRSLQDLKPYTETAWRKCAKGYSHGIVSSQHRKMAGDRCRNVVWSTHHTSWTFLRSSHPWRLDIPQRKMWQQMWICDPLKRNQYETILRVDKAKMASLEKYRFDGNWTINGLWTLKWKSTHDNWLHSRPLDLGSLDENRTIFLEEDTWKCFLHMGTRPIDTRLYSTLSPLQHHLLSKLQITCTEKSTTTQEELIMALLVNSAVEALRLERNDSSFTCHNYYYEE